MQVERTRNLGKRGRTLTVEPTLTKVVLLAAWGPPALDWKATSAELPASEVCPDRNSMGPRPRTATAALAMDEQDPMVAGYSRSSRWMSRASTLGSQYYYEEISDQDQEQRRDRR